MRILIGVNLLLGASLTAAVAGAAMQAAAAGGDAAAAAEAYRRTLAIDPANEEARRRLQALGAKP